jgi:hypothetical protein
MSDDKHFRWDVINGLVKEMGYESYLEIGVRKGACFNNVKLGHKVGVDPASPVDGVRKMASDEFFATDASTFDIIFLDGDHRWPQVTRDLVNALARLNPGGTVVMHDCMAPIQKHATMKHTSGRWNGTVWRAFGMFRMTRPDLEMWTIKDDHGVGIVRPGAQQVYQMHSASEFSHDYYKHFMKEVLNLVSFKRFFEEVVPRWKERGDV